MEKFYVIAKKHPARQNLKHHQNTGRQGNWFLVLTTYLEAQNCAQEWTGSLSHHFGYVPVCIEVDGDKYCAHYEDFINFQESPAGFGDSITSAVENLDNLNQEE